MTYSEGFVKIKGMIALIKQEVQVGKYLYAAAIALSLLILWDLFYNYGKLTVEFLFLVTGDV